MDDLDQCAECGRFFGETSRIKAQLTQAQAEIAEWRDKLDAQHRLNLNFVGQNNTLIRRNQKLDGEIAALREVVEAAVPLRGWALCFNLDSASRQLNAFDAAYAKAPLPTQPKPPEEGDKGEEGQG